MGQASAGNGSVVGMQYEATKRLRKLADDSVDECLATQAIRGKRTGLITELRQRPSPHTTTSISTICAATAKRRALTGKAADNRPCMWCGDTSDQATMVLCNCCNAC